MCITTTFKVACKSTNLVLKKNNYGRKCVKLQFKFWNYMSVYCWTGPLPIVGLVKRSLKKRLGKKLLTYDQFNTIVMEAESVGNSHPLIYEGDDINSKMVISLRTSCVWILLQAFLREYQNTVTLIISAEQILKYVLEKGQRLLDSFWNISSNEYLTSLRERTQVHLKAGRTQLASLCKVGDLVLKKDDMPRGNWRIGN